MIDKAEAIKKALTKNFQYNVDYDYDRDDSGCTCDYICRCSRLINVKVRSVDIAGISTELNREVKGNAFTEYAINRILTACKIYDCSKWNIVIGGGYYGEEVDGVYLEDSEVAADWLEKLMEAETDRDKVFIALQCEYGYVLDKIKTASDFEITVIEKDKIKIGQEEYYRKLDMDIVNIYKDFELPRGICIKDGETYRLFDGYHRVASADYDFVKMIVGKE